MRPYNTVNDIEKPNRFVKVKGITMNTNNIIQLQAIGFFTIPRFAETQSTNVDSETDARTWETDAHGVDLSFTQILPEQAQAFYVNQGFTLVQITPYTASCVCMTVLRNDHAPGTIHYHGVNRLDHVSYVGADLAGQQWLSH
jgi:hypothetical protein